MAITWTKTPVISKLKVNGVVQYIKDAEARAQLEALLEALGQSAYTNYDTVVTKNSENLITSGAVAEAIAGLTQFDLEVVQELPKTGKKGVIYLVSKGKGKTGYIEYLWITSQSKFEEIGDTDIDLSNYYTKDETNSEINSAISTLEGKLGKLAWKDSATGQVAGETISGLRATGTIDAQLYGELKYTQEAISLQTSYTPQGNITGGKVIAGGTISVPTISIARSTTARQVVTDLVDSDSDVASFTEGQFIPNTPTVINVDKFNGGSVATYGTDNYVSAKLTDAVTDTFAQAGIVASIDKEDNEMLVFTAATTATAVVNRGTFTEGTYEHTGFDGGSVATLEEGFYTAGTAATKEADVFTATKVKVASVENIYDIDSITADAPTFTGSEVYVTDQTFEGVSTTITTTGSYEKANRGTLYVEAQTEGFDVDDFIISTKDVTVY